MRTISLILLCAAIPSAAQLNSSKPTKPVQLTNEDLVRMHTTWGPKANRLGTKLTLKHTAQSGSAFSIQFVATGLPRDRQYNLMSFPTTRVDAIVLVRGIWLDANGRAMCASEQGQCKGAKSKSGPLTMKVAPAPGEPLRLALVASNDAGLAAFVNETLTPLIASDKGCRVEAVILDPRNALMHVTATGLPRGGSFTLASDSGGNATVMNLTADKTGHYSAGLMPASPSKKTGTIRLRLLASTCRVTLGVPYVLTQ